MNREDELSGLSAENADRHELYEISVQQPQVMLGFIDDFCEAMELPQPQSLREDFCGTANLSTWFIRLGDGCTAIGIDNDSEVLAWAKANNRSSLGDEIEQLTLIEADVFQVEDKADLIISLNFSHFYFKEREELLAYLKHSWSNLNYKGLMLLDAFGGSGTSEPCRDERDFGSYRYIWEQKNYNLLTHEIDCRIHFEFPDDTAMNDAFVYDWRLYSLPEMKDLLFEAGFSEVGFYFESEEGFTSDPDEVNAEAWVVYIIAMK